MPPTLQALRQPVAVPLHPAILGPLTQETPKEIPKRTFRRLQSRGRSLRNSLGVSGGSIRPYRPDSLLPAPLAVNKNGRFRAVLVDAHDVQVVIANHEVNVGGRGVHAVSA